MNSMYSFEQYCPKCGKNIVVDEQYLENGDVELFCREKEKCDEKCEIISRITVLLSDRKNF